MLTISKVTSSLPLSTQTQLPMHPTSQINFPPPSYPFLTSMPQSKPKQLSKDPTHHGSIPKFSKPSGNIVDLSDVGVAKSLPLIAWNSEPNATQSDPWFPKPNPILIFVQSCNWIICQSANPRTLENPQHNSSSKSFKLTSRVPRCIIPCQHIPWLFQRQNWTHPQQIFTISFSWSVSFSTCPASKADQIYSSHSHWNLQTHFCFWK